MKDVKYPIELEVVTPLSVGAGNENEWTCGIDYVQKDGKAYVLDIQKAKNVDSDKLSSLFLKSDEQGICRLLGNSLKDIARYVFPLPVRTSNPIKTFLRSQLFDKPVVAGSSLKGSVRSALFNYLRTSEESNEEVFGSMKDGTDFMRFIRIADVEMPSTELVNSKIFNLCKENGEWNGGWKHGGARTDQHYNPTGFNTLYECVVPGKKGLGAITLAGNAFGLIAENRNVRMSYAEKKKELLATNISTLFKVINNVTREYLRKEKAFFLKYPADRTDELISDIDNLLGLIPDDGSSCLLKMSAGVGFHSITGDWKYDDYDDTGVWQDQRNRGKKMYKSRKTVEYKGLLHLMGFVRLRTLSADEVSQMEQLLRIEHEEIADSVLTPMREAEAARVRQAEEERQRLRAKAEMKRKQEEFQNLMLQARISYDEGLWDEAIAVLNKAVELCPDSGESRNLLEICNNAKSAEAYRQGEQKAAKQKFSKSLSDVIANVSSVGNLVGTTAKWLKTDGNKFGDVEYGVFLNAINTLPPKEKGRLKSKRKDLVKAIGEEFTVKLFNDI